MVLKFTLFLPALWSLCADAVLTPRGPTRSYSNSSSSTSSRSSTTPVCCFVVQDTVHEEWWHQTAYSTTQQVVNLTSITTFITQYPNVTSTRYETNVYLKNTSRVLDYQIGINPLTNFINGAPGPTEIDHGLNGTAVVTGGITVQSPGAFYVYSTVKIITAAQVTDSEGSLVCATPSSFASVLEWNADPLNTNLPTFASINSNAEAYFGGLGIAGPTEVPALTYTTAQTYTDTVTESLLTRTITTTALFTQTSLATRYTDSAGLLMTAVPPTEAKIISLRTPFVYLPDRGATGATSFGRPCLQTGGTENYGYVPQTVLDFLIQNKEYSSQYPGLESCLPGGPSIIQVTDCVTAAPSQQMAGGELTEGTVVYVTLPGEGGQGRPQSTPNPPQSKGNPNVSRPGQQSQITPEPQPQSVVSQPEQRPSPSPIPVSQPQQQPSNAIGALINSIMGGMPANTPASQPQPQPHTEPEVQNSSQVQAITIPAATAIPLVSAPAGLIGSTGVVDGTPVIFIPGPTTLIAPPTPPAIVNIGQTTLINGFPFVVIPGPTTIPLAGSPPELRGTTTTIDGTAFLVIPTPTTIPVHPPAPGTANIIEGAGITTVIDGMSFLVLPSATMIPLSLLPTGVVGASTTTINGIPYLIVPSSTPLPLFSLLPSPTATNSRAPSRTGVGGQLTAIIDGSTVLIIAGPTTMPANPDFSISGVTTVIDGTSMVVVTGTQTATGRGKTTSTPADITSKSSASLGGPTETREPAAPSADSGSAKSRHEKIVLWIGIGFMIGFGLL